MSRSTFLHLRIPFSFLLMPVFLFAWAISENVDFTNLVLVFMALHVFLYPASNGYNSYFDKDEGSIGGLERPPEVSLELYRVSLLFDLSALLIGVFVSWQFTVMLLIYGFISKAYSHPSVRLKKYPFLSWLVIGIFQGAFTFLMVVVGITGKSVMDISMEEITPALLSSVLLLGSYPMTQIYQHDEDKERGDRTISLLLGIRGTFILTGLLFGFATSLYFFYFFQLVGIELSAAFIFAMSPTVLFFMLWLLRVWKDESKVNFRSTMNLNLISAQSLNLFFLYLGYVIS